jgi:hypothetical protein
LSKKQQPIDFDDPNWRTILNKQLHELLTILDRAKREGGEGWVSSAKLPNIPYHTRQIASVKGCIEGRGTTTKREYRILPAGQQALADGKAPDPERKREVSGLDIETSPAAEPQAAFAGIPIITNRAPSNGNGIIPMTMTELAHSEPGYPAPSALIHSTQKNNPAPIAATPLPPYPRACVQVIEILREDFPEVGDLVDALMKLNSRKGAAHE